MFTPLSNFSLQSLQIVGCWVYNCVELLCSAAIWSWSSDNFFPHFLVLSVSKTMRFMEPISWIYPTFQIIGNIRGQRLFNHSVFQIRESNWIRNCFSGPLQCKFMQEESYSPLASRIGAHADLQGIPDVLIEMFIPWFRRVLQSQFSFGQQSIFFRNKHDVLKDNHWSQCEASFLWKVLTKKLPIICRFYSMVGHCLNTIKCSEKLKFWERFSHNH